MSIITSGIPILYIQDVDVTGKTPHIIAQPDENNAVLGSYLTVIMDKRTLFPSGIGYYVVIDPSSGLFQGKASAANTTVNSSHASNRIAGGYTRWTVKDVVNMSLTTTTLANAPIPARRLVPFSPATAFSELPVDSVGKQLVYTLAKIITLASPISASSLQQTFGNLDKVVSELNTKMVHVLTSVILGQEVLDKILEQIALDEGVWFDKSIPNITRLEITRGKREICILLNNVSLGMRIEYDLGANDVVLGSIPMMVVLRDEP